MAASIGAAAGTRGIYESDQGINSTQNTSASSSVKGENGFCILASVYNDASNQYIQNFQAITFDSAPKVGVKRQAEVTSYPVENGADVSDHVQIKNNTFTMTGVITETPIRLMRDMLYSAGVNGTRISQAITYLDQIFESRQPIILITEHKIFETVILKGFSYDYESEFAMQFNLEFEQIRLVSYADTNVIATKTKPNKSTGGTVKQKVSTPPKSDLTERTGNATGSSNLNNGAPSGR